MVAWNGLPAPGAGKQRLRLGGARKQSPQDVFHGPLNPLSIGQAQHLPRLGIGIDNPARALQENQHWQCVEHLLLFGGIRVFRKIQIHVPRRNECCRHPHIPSHHRWTRFQSGTAVDGFSCSRKKCAVSIAARTTPVAVFSSHPWEVQSLKSDRHIPAMMASQWSCLCLPGYYAERRPA